MDMVYDIATVYDPSQTEQKDGVSILPQDSQVQVAKQHIGSLSLEMFCR
jgi:hypothetical protein